MDDTERAFPGDTEMARRMRALDWAATPLGDPGQWPASLRTACRICLTSRFPMVVFWGERLHFLYNDDYLPFLGTKHPALAKPAAEVWDEIWDVIGPMLDSVRATGQPTWQDRQLLRMNRNGYWEETYWTYSFSPLHDDAGVVRGVFTAATDATGPVIGERRLAALNELGALASRARSVPEACGLVGQVLGRAQPDVPYAAVYLRQPDGSLAAQVTSPAVTGRPAEPGAWPVAEAAAAGRAVRVTDVAARFGSLPSGGWPEPPAQAMVIPLAGETGGQALGVIVLAASAGRALDDAYESFLGLIAQQTAAVINSAVAYEAQLRRAEELAELDRAKTVFFANVSHELRTPLALILGPLAELRAGLADQGAAVREDLDIMQRNGLRLSRLVNTMLDFSRIEAGRLRARFELVDLAELTADLASVFRSAIEKAGLAYEVDCPALPGPVPADREMWEQVVLNLLSNALKFTLDGGISVSLRAEGGDAVLRVADTGSGVPAAELPRLFERFHRVPSTRSRSSEGSGIGLALVREFAGLHGGTAVADSTEGAGTVVTVRLPLRRADLPESRPVPAPPADRGPAARGPAAEPFLEEMLRWLPADAGGLDAAPGAARSYPDLLGPAPGGAARVLVADDNADMRQYLRRLLAPYYRIDTVPDGRAALDAARADPPDLIVSDVMMPGLDGIALVGALRASTATAAVPVLLLSARTGQDAAIAGLDAGADDYLVKPFAAGELLARVRGHLQLARLRSGHARWRAAVLDSLQEAFFTADESGAITEINPAFTQLLGFGPDGLPYRPPYPWGRTAEASPDAPDETFEQVLGRGRGTVIRPARHRDGRLLWVAASVAEIRDPDTGRRQLAGTFRDVTAEHYAGQRESALAAIGILLSRAGSVPDAVRGAIGELRDLWGARRVLAVTWRGPRPPSVSAAGDGATWDELAPDLRERIGALRAGPPLRPSAADGAVGITLEHPEGLLALWIEPDPAVPFAAEDLTLLALLCGHLVQALHRIHLASQQRETALALQRAILGPAHRPAGFAVRYEPASRPLEIGGDWYDLVALAGGRIGIVVGDCVSHGLEAATIMGQVRSACRALLLEEISPARVLDALDRFTELIPGGMCSTAFCGILDPRTGQLTYSSAGHPPGILVRADGQASLLEDGRALPLAVDSGTRRPDAQLLLPAGATLLLYTDGLIEHRHRTLDDGLAQATAAVQAGLGVPVEELAAQVLSRLTPPGGYKDDVALVVYRRPAPAAPAARP
jgi:PAS domain S-box-containing protein